MLECALEKDSNDVQKMFCNKLFIITRQHTKCQYYNINFVVIETLMFHNYFLYNIYIILTYFNHIFFKNVHYSSVPYYTHKLVFIGDNIIIQCINYWSFND
jgi:hypothetical protein